MGGDKIVLLDGAGANGGGAATGVAFIRWLAVQDYLGEKINWKDLT